jgi:hypothetical protein
MVVVAGGLSVNINLINAVMRWYKKRPIVAAPDEQY